MVKKKSLKSLPLLSKLTLLLGLLLFTLTSTGEKVKLIETPLGFPEIDVPNDNPITKAKIDLGEKLFFEKLLSRDSSISCASCHNPSYAFTDGLQKARGIKDREVTRNTPTLTNIAYNTSFLRDGVNPSLEAQVIVPIHEKNEFDFHILLVAEIVQGFHHSTLHQKKRLLKLLCHSFYGYPDKKSISLNLFEQFF